MENERQSAFPITIEDNGNASFEGWDKFEKKYLKEKKDESKTD